LGYLLAPLLKASSRAKKVPMTKTWVYSWIAILMKEGEPIKAVDNGCWMLDTTDIGYSEAELLYAILSHVFKNSVRSANFLGKSWS